MQGFSPLRQLCQISIFQSFRERIKERPYIALLEFLVPGFTPFMEDGRDEPIAAHADIAGPNSEVSNCIKKTAFRAFHCEIQPMKREHGELPDARNVEQLTAQNVKAIAELERVAHVQKTLSDRIADVITRFCGSMSFLWVHVVWFALWIGVNMGMGKGALDPFPFNFLTLIVSLEAIFLSTFILISENRQSRVDERRSHLDLQINLLSEQENTKMLHMLAEISKKLGIDDPKDQEIELLKQATKPEALVEQIDQVMAKEPSEK